MASQRNKLNLCTDKFLTRKICTVTHILKYSMSAIWLMQYTEEYLYSYTARLILYSLFRGWGLISFFGGLIVAVDHRN